MTGNWNFIKQGVLLGLWAPFLLYLRMKSHASNPHAKNQILGSSQDHPYIFVLSSWGTLFVKEPDHRYPIRLHVLECIFLALRQWTREGYSTSQQGVWLQEQWLLSGHKVLTVSLCAGPFLGMHTSVRWVTQRTSLPVTRDPRSSCLSVTQCHQEKNACLGQWESDTQTVPGAWSLYSTPQGKCAAPWPQAHNGHEDLLFTEPIPSKKVPTQQQGHRFPYFRWKLALQREHVIPFSQSVDILHFWSWKNLGTVVNVDV